MRGWTIAMAALLLAAATPVGAQSQAPSLEGAWTYRTAVWTASKCVISGTAVLTRMEGQGNAYHARLVSTQSCEYARSIVAEQECSVRDDARRISVTCRVLSADPPSSYLPDDFVLEVRTSDWLVGRLTANWNAPAEWRRSDRPPVA